MNSASDPKIFKQILVRNVTLPLVMATLLSAIFIGMIFHLITVRRWVDHSDQVVARGHQSLQHIVDAETGLRGFLLTGKENFLEPYHWATDDFDPRMKEFIQLVNDNPAQADRLNTIQSRFHDWNSYATELIEAKRQHKPVMVIVTSERGKQKMDEIRREFADFIRFEEALRDERSQSSEATIRMALILIVAASLILGTMLALYSKKQLIALSEDYTRALQKQIAQNEVLQKQDWLQTGQANLAYEMRGEHTVENLSATVMNTLAHYLNVAVGTLYVSDESMRLNRSATYAFSGQELQDRSTIAFGQSLVGQAAAEKRTLVVNDIPESYLQVSSGLGSQKPVSIVIVPMVADDKVQAVLELGFTQALSDRARELLEKISESVAIGIRSAQYRVRLQNLLEESQKQAEELQVQQEELRVNNEELEEQSKALKASQVQLESQQSELEQINSQLEEQAQRLEQQTEQLNEQNDDLNKTRIVLEQKAHELEVSSQYKSQFLANMSHELRTPLNSTLILAQLILENKNKNLSKEEMEYARTILGSSNDLLTLINDILDLSKVEAGKIDLNPEMISISQVLDGLKRTFKPVAETKNISLNFEIDPSLPADQKVESIETDRQRLEQILKNLISNALKFTDKGEVKLQITVQNRRVRFTVSDTGIGISKEQQGVIFEAFRQADGTTNRRFGGTGLGLTISRDLAKLLGGSIEVTSVVGKGSSFTLVLPLKFQAEAPPEVLAKPVESKLEAQKFFESQAAAEPRKKATQAVKLSFADDRDHLEKNLKVLLVVEDDQVFAKILYDLSHEMKFQCLVALNAEEGIEMAEGFLPNAVILDMNLPDHSGLAVLDHLKENPKTRHIPVHVVSGQDRSQAAYQMGAIGYTLKPVPREELKQAIEKLQDKFTQEFKQVLVVEDNLVQRDAICKLIEDKLVKTTAVETGKEALEELSKKIFDCMIVDLSLPDMTGFELLEKLSKSNSNYRLPVIVYTGREITRLEEEQLKKYSNSIIIKGARSPERLLSEVTLFLHQVESQMPAERQRTLQEFRDREKIFESRRILLVDDDVRNIFALGSALESKGATVIVARNGEEAVTQVKNTPNLDLVLMDIMMPIKDGYEAMREIRKDARFSKLPIIAVTAKAMPDDQKKCIDAGANDYLSKPIDLQKLLSLIRVWMPKEGKISS